MSNTSDSGNGKGSGKKATGKNRAAKPKPPKDNGGNGDKQTGRPPIVFDYEQVEALGALHATQEEIAAVLGCSVDTMSRRMQDDPAFAEAYKKGLAADTLSLKRRQKELAEKGNVAMLIWLGKQYLGQAERTAVSVTNNREEENAYAKTIAADPKAKAAAIELYRRLEGVGGDSRN